MKKTISAFIVLIAAATLFAAVVPLAWDDTGNNPAEIIEYRLYNTTITETATNRVRIARVVSDGLTTTNIRHTVELPTGTNVVTVTAVNNAGLESEDSESLTVVVPQRPENLKVNLMISPISPPQ